MKNPFNFEAEPFEFYEFEGGRSSKPCRCNQHSGAVAGMFDEYEAEQSDAYSEFNEEYEFDLEGELFEIDQEYDEAYEMEKDPDPVDVGAGRIICGVVYRDFKAWYDALADLWQELRNKGSRDNIKKARAALYKVMVRIEKRLRDRWYEGKGCKAVDFNFLISKAIMTDPELKTDAGVQKMSKRLSVAAQEALKRAEKASRRRRPARRGSP